MYKIILSSRLINQASLRLIVASRGTTLYFRLLLPLMIKLFREQNLS